MEWPRHPYPDVGTVYFYYFHRTPYPIPQHHSWVKGGTAYSDAEDYGHAIPSRVVRPVATLMVGHQRVFYTYGPLFGLIMLTGLGGVLRLRLRRGRLPRLSWSPRTGSMLPWATAVALLVFPIAVADFDYRYLLPVLPFACLAAGLAFAPARVPPPGTGPRAAGRPHQPGARTGRLKPAFANSCRFRRCHFAPGGADLCKGGAIWAKPVIDDRIRGGLVCDCPDEPSGSLCWPCSSWS